MIFGVLVLGAGALIAYSYVQYALVRAVKYHQNHIELLPGFIEVALQEPNEGIVVLRQKRTWRFSSEREGARVWLLPCLGDELVLRVPLTSQLHSYEANGILSSDGLQFDITLSCQWSVVNLYSFVTLLRVPGREDLYSIDYAAKIEHWVNNDIQNAAQAVVSKVAFSPWIFDAVDPDRVSGSSHQSWGALSSLIVSAMCDDLLARTFRYGVEIEQLDVRRIKLPDGIQAKLNDLYETRIHRLVADLEVDATEAQFRRLSASLGKEAALRWLTARQQSGLNVNISGIGMDLLSDRKGRAESDDHD